MSDHGNNLLFVRRAVVLSIVLAGIATTASSATTGIKVASGKYDGSSWTLLAEDGKNGSFSITMLVGKRLSAAEGGKLNMSGTRAITYLPIRVALLPITSSAQSSRRQPTSSSPTRMDNVSLCRLSRPLPASHGTSASTSASRAVRRCAQNASSAWTLTGSRRRDVASGSIPTQHLLNSPASFRNKRGTPLAAGTSLAEIDLA